MSKVLRLGFGCLALATALVLPAGRAEAGHCKDLIFLGVPTEQICQSTCASNGCSGYRYFDRTAWCECTHH